MAHPNTVIPGDIQAELRKMYTEVALEVGGRLRVHLERSVGQEFATTKAALEELVSQAREGFNGTVDGLATLLARLKGLQLNWEEFLDEVKAEEERRLSELRPALESHLTELAQRMGDNIQREVTAALAELAGERIRTLEALLVSRIAGVQERLEIAEQSRERERESLSETLAEAAAATESASTLTNNRIASLEKTLWVLAGGNVLLLVGIIKLLSR